MRLKKLSHNFEKYKDYEDEQKLVLSSIISRLNRIGDFFDVVVKLEKFVIEEVRDEYTKLIEVRNKKAEIEAAEDSVSYIQNHFLPAVEALNQKMESSIQSWNHVEREYTTGKVFGFISAMKNFYKELEAMDSALPDEDSDLHGSSMTTLIKDILDNFGKFKMYKAIMSDDVIVKLETLLSMQEDMVGEKSETKKLTLDDL
jgi:hypothetical protein